jgi:flagellar hook protein FlgE
MLQALLSGVASIRAQQTRMNVIGDNLANVNTTAHKSARVSFQGMIAQTVRGASRPNATMGGLNPIQLGLGVLVSGNDINIEQGFLSATNRPADLAIQGNGFFVLGNGAGVTYTRDGAFNLDANGDVVHRSSGFRLLGWPADSQGNLDTTVPLSPSSTLSIPVGQLSAVQATSNVNLVGNLDGRADPTAEWTTTARVYDQLGGEHVIKIRFYNRVPTPASPPAPNGAVASWDWEATESGSATIIGGSAGATPTGEPLYFDMDGRSMNPQAVNSLTVPAGTAPPFTLALNLETITQVATDSQVQLSRQDGFPPGSLQSYAIGTDGIITGQFTNGLSRTLGQIAISIFPNPVGMERIGSNLWQATDNSGLPVTGLPNVGGRGGVSSGYLEQSNVDIGSEFTDLIITQRGFQANTKVVTTVDEMLQDLLAMKR